jgi:hypothetical protein
VKNLLKNELNFDITSENLQDFSFTCRAYENTWSHQRRKRRQLNREMLDTEPPLKKAKSKQTNENNDKIPLIECSIQVKQTNELSFVQIDHKSGQNKDYSHQISQFIQNKLAIELIGSATTL